MTTEAQFLVPQDIYLKSGIHIGTKSKTKYMEDYIYKVRSDGLSVLNLQKIDERIKHAAKLLSQYEPEQILVVSRRENGWDVVKLFCKYTGAKAHPGRYPPGILTNPQLETFTEVKVLLTTDPIPDKNAIRDAQASGMLIIALCDTNNTMNEIDFAIPCNNKGKKSLGLVFYILAQEYLKAKGKTAKMDVEEFMQE